MASRLQGKARVRRLLKEAPDHVARELGRVLEGAGRLNLMAMRARTPRRTGALQRGLSMKVLMRTLRLRVGLLGTPGGRSKLFYGRIQDLGRRAQTTRARRMVNPNYPKRWRSEKAATLRKFYVPLKVKPAAPKRFITGRYPEFRRVIGERLRGIWGRALKWIGDA